MYTVDTLELKKAILEKGFETIGACADAAGISRNTLGGILKGKVMPSTNIILALATALNLEGPDIARIFFRKQLA